VTYEHIIARRAKTPKSSSLPSRSATGAVLVLSSQTVHCCKQESKKLMIYKGFEFNIIQGIAPGVWKWSISTGGSRGRTGQTASKPNAVVAAWRAIDQALEPKKTSAAAARR
jgi:hypothetical protein